jgi:hypothetical protein
LFQRWSSPTFLTGQHYLTTASIPAAEAPSPYFACGTNKKLRNLIKQMSQSLS